MKRLAPRTCACSLITTLAFTVTVHAQQREAIENITVWAQKRESVLSDVPLSLTVVTKDDLSSGGLNQLVDVAERLPTLDLQQTASPTTTTLRIRRIGALGNIPTFEPAVGFFVDGAYRSRSVLATSDLVDVQRIEVLNGPQSTYYGRSASAGVISLYTQPPGDAFTVQTEVTTGTLSTAGSPSLMRLKLGVSGPLTSKLGMGLAASYVEHGHTIENALPGAPNGNNDRRVAARGQMKLSINDRADLRLIAGYARERDDQGELDVYLAPNSRSRAVADALSASGFSSGCSDNEPANRTTCSVATNKLDLEAFDATLLGDFQLANGWQLQSITSFDSYTALRDDSDAMQLFTPVLFFDDSEEGQSLQQELRLSSSAGPISWLVSIYGYRNEYDRGKDGDRPMFGATGPAAYAPIWTSTLGGIPLALPDQLALHDSALDTRYISTFGSARWSLTPRLSIEAGLRWHKESKDATINNSVTVPGPSLLSVVLAPAFSPNGQPVNGSATRETDALTWRVTPQLRINDSMMAYLVVGSGLKSGGFNTGFGNAPLSAREFDDERSLNYELGLRASSTDGRVRLSAAAFYTEYDDYQDAAFVSAQFSVGNVDTLRSRGFEIEGDVLLGDRWRVDAAVSLADVVYVKNTTGMCYPGRMPDGSAPRSCDLSGEHPINAPPWSTHVGVQYEYPTTWGRVSARVDWDWTDRRNTSFSVDPRLSQSSYHDIGLRAGLNFGDAYELVLWTENVLNETVTYGDVVLNFFNDASYQSQFARPRSYGVTLRARF